MRMRQMPVEEQPDPGSAAGYGADETPPWMKKRFPYKTITAALVLFTVGGFMLWLGIRNLRTDYDRGVAMCVLGSLMFIPGSYATYIIFGVFRGWKNYKFSSLPSYDD